MEKEQEKVRFLDELDEEPVVVVKRAPIVEKTVVVEKEPAENRSRLPIIIGIVAVILICVGLVWLWGFLSPKLATAAVYSAQMTATAVAVVPADSGEANAVAIPTQVATKAIAVAQATTQPVEEPTPTVFVPIVGNVETITQVGGGDEVIKKGWTDPGAVMVIPSRLDTNLVVLISSDPKNTVTLFDKEGKVLKTFSGGDKGFILAVTLNKGMTVEMSGVGFNDPNGHYNVWAEAFVWPEGFSASDTMKSKLKEWEAREKKPIAAQMTSDGKVEYLKGP